MDDLDALLADLQGNSSSNLNHPKPLRHVEVNSSHHQQHQQQQEQQVQHHLHQQQQQHHPPDHSMMNHGEPIYEPQKVKHGSGSREVVREDHSTSTTTTTHHGGTRLNELDNLLEELAQANHKDGGPPPSNGYAGGAARPSYRQQQYEEQQQSYVSTRNMSQPVANQPVSSTPYSTSRPNQPGHSATKELDDLMASLNEFKVNSSASQPSPLQASSSSSSSHHHHYQHQQPQQHSPRSPYYPPTSPPQQQQHHYHQHHQQQQQPQYHQQQHAQHHPQHHQQNHHQQAQHHQQHHQPVMYSSSASFSPAGVGGERQYHPEQHSSQRATSGHNELDTMLGDLQSDMSKQGVRTVPKGHCGACHKPIVGQVVTALGCTWHPEHFVCAHCQYELGTRNFFERDGKPYCEKDYHQLFSPRCSYCNQAILDKCITALGRTWHPDHFFCHSCGRRLGEDGFHEKDGRAYCKDDYFDMFAPKCGACNRPIMENYISALNTQFHPQCFVCTECKMAFEAGSFFDHEGLPYCETHYHAKRGSLCGGCNKPITGRCITAMHKKFHPEHFICAFCLKPLNKGTFKEEKGKPYCHTCYGKLFA